MDRMARQHLTEDDKAQVRRAADAVFTWLEGLVNAFLNCMKRLSVNGTERNKAYHSLQDVITANMDKMPPEVTSAIITFLRQMVDCDVEQANIIEEAMKAPEELWPKSI